LKENIAKPLIIASPRGDLLVVGLMISNFGEILLDDSEHCVSVEVFSNSDFEVAGKADQGCNGVVFFFITSSRAPM
jgi:hypothetical protein